MSNVNPVQGSLITWTPTVVQEMDRHEYDDWQMRRGSNDPSVFNSTFQSNNISFADGMMTLSLDNEGCPSTCAGRPYASGEYRTIENFGYGYYEVRMRPAAGSGLVSTFFTHRGTSGGSSHDEIDFEFRGMNTREVQLNYFVEGRGGHEEYVDLGFDASQEFHNFGFRWSPESIIWYVDGREVYRVVEDPGTPGHEIPYRPGRITANFWAGTEGGWAGAFSYPGHPLSAEYDWIKYSTLEAAAAGPAPTAAPARPTSAICPEQIERSILYVADPEIGIMHEDGRAELRLVDIADKVEYRQVEEIMNALTGAIPDNRIINPDIAWQSLDENHKLYPELGRILELDEQCSYQFYRYFNDSRTYWDNAITLLSVYVQMSLERNELDKMEYALEMVERFRARIANQEIADRASPTRISSCPSSYKMAQLGLVEAEIRSQIQSADINYYIEGVNTALDSIAVMLSLQYDTEYPSAPDYFGIAKGILTLGNLYMQIANLTKEEKYFEAAHQLFQSLAGLRSELSVQVGIHIDLGRLFRDPLLLENEERVDLAPDPYGIFSSLYEINAGPQEIYEALKFNLEQKYILPQDIDNAMTGVFNYLKGVALIGDANLLIAWPRVKTMDVLLSQLDNVNRGIEELRMAAQSSGRGVEKIRYYVHAANLIKGNLFLALADRLTFYNENPGLLGSSTSPAEIWERLIDMPEISPYLTEYLPPNMPFGEAFIGVDFSAFSSFGDRKEEIWGALISAGYLSEGGIVLPRFDGRKESFHLPVSLTAEERNKIFNILKEAVAFSSFGDRKEEIWGALISAGYLSEDGIILPRFDGRKENFNLPVSLTEEERSMVFNVLKEALANAYFKRSVALIKTLREQYFTYVPEDLKYLYAWSRVKLLEIIIRLAEYVRITGQGHIGDAAEMLGFSDQIGPLVEELCRLNPAIEYLGIEFNYLHTIPLLLGEIFPKVNKDSFPGFGGKKGKIWTALIDAGYINEEGLIQPGFDGKIENFILPASLEGKRNEIFNLLRRTLIAGPYETAPADDYGEIGIKRNSQSYAALATLEQLESKILSLPPSLYTYFKVYIKLKEVIALLQIYYDVKKMKIEKNRALGVFLREHSPKYKYEDGTLLIDGRMTAEELAALSACYTQQEDKDKIEKLFQLTNVVKDFVERTTGQEISPREYKDRLAECALGLLREVESETAPAIPSYLWINVTRTLPELLGKEQLTQKERKQQTEIPKALIKFIFGTSEKLPENEKLKQFVEQHSSKYRYENDMLMVNGQMTVEEKEALLACFSPEANKDKAEKDKIEQLFRRSRGAREFPPSLIEKVLALKTKIDETRVDREACKNILNQLLVELGPLNSSNQDFLDYNVEIAAWDVHSLYAELYHGFALIYGTLSHGRATTAPESSAFWQYAQSAYLESAWSYSPYDRNHRPFFLFKLLDKKFPDNTVAELAELEQRMRAQANPRRASSHDN
jgi:beta-glucanase (GH16 family)